MSASQRTKGSAGERDLCHAIEADLGVRLVRNLEQSRTGGHDLIVHPDAHGPAADALRRLAIEVKRSARAQPADLSRFWSQAVQQADRARLAPCLAYREDRQGWRVRLPLSAFWPASFPLWSSVDMTVDVSLSAFAALIREGCVLTHDEREAQTGDLPVQVVEIDAGVVGQDPVLSGRFQRGDESAASQPPSGVAERFDQMPAIFKDGMTGNPSPDIRTRTDPRGSALLRPLPG
jgi:hypothetical protein